MNQTPGLYAGPGVYPGPGFYPKFYGKQWGLEIHDTALVC